MTRSSKSTSPPVSQRTKSRGLKTCLHTHVHNIILNSQQMEATQGPVKGWLASWLAGESVVYTVNETLVSLGKEGNGNISCSRSEP